MWMTYTQSILTPPDGLWELLTYLQLEAQLGVTFPPHWTGINVSMANHGKQIAGTGGPSGFG